MTFSCRENGNSSFQWSQHNTTKIHFAVILKAALCFPLTHSCPLPHHLPLCSQQLRADQSVLFPSLSLVFSVRYWVIQCSICCWLFVDSKTTPLETYVILKHELFYFKGHWEMKTEGRRSLLLLMSPLNFSSGYTDCHVYLLQFLSQASLLVNY